jgi:hypothetical protein
MRHLLQALSAASQKHSTQPIKLIDTWALEIGRAAAPSRSAYETQQPNGSCASWRARSGGDTGDRVDHENGMFHPVRSSGRLELAFSQVLQTLAYARTRPIRHIFHVANDALQPLPILALRAQSVRGENDNLAALLFMICRASNS